VNLGVVITQHLLYIAIATFVITLLIRSFRYARMPIHLRWETYPVPHEEGKVVEFKELLSELLFIKRVFYNKPKLWLFTYPLHLGIYLILTWLTLLVIGSLATISGILRLNVVTPYHYLMSVVAYLGAGLILLGSISLILYRIINDEMRRYTVPIDYFNLILIALVAISGIVAWCSTDPLFVNAVQYVASLITFNIMTTIPNTILTSPTMLYIYYF